MPKPGGPIEGYPPPSSAERVRQVWRDTRTGRLSGPLIERLRNLFDFRFLDRTFSLLSLNRMGVLFEDRLISRLSEIRIERPELFAEIERSFELSQRTLDLALNSPQRFAEILTREVQLRLPEEVQGLLVGAQIEAAPLYTHPFRVDFHNVSPEPSQNLFAKPQSPTLTQVSIPLPRLAGERSPSLVLTFDSPSLRFETSGVFNWAPEIKLAYEVQRALFHNQDLSVKNQFALEMEMTARQSTQLPAESAKYTLAVGVLDSVNGAGLKEAVTAIAERAREQGGEAYLLDNGRLAVMLPEKSSVEAAKVLSSVNIELSRQAVCQDLKVSFAVEEMAEPQSQKSAPLEILDQMSRNAVEVLKSDNQANKTLVSRVGHAYDKKLDGLTSSVLSSQLGQAVSAQLSTPARAEAEARPAGGMELVPDEGRSASTAVADLVTPRNPQDISARVQAQAGMVAPETKEARQKATQDRDWEQRKAVLEKALSSAKGTTAHLESRVRQNTVAVQVKPEIQDQQRVLTIEENYQQREQEQREQRQQQEKKQQQEELEYLKDKQEEEWQQILDSEEPRYVRARQAIENICRLLGIYVPLESLSLSQRVELIERLSVRGVSRGGGVVKLGVETRTFEQQVYALPMVETAAPKEVSDYFLGVLRQYQVQDGMTNPQVHGAPEVRTKTKTASSPLQKMIEKALAKYEFLKLFPREMYEQGQLKRYTQAEVVIEQGVPGRALFLILKGKVKVEIFDSQGKVINTFILDSGVVGEAALMRRSLTNARVTALPGAKLLSVSSQDFQKNLRSVLRSQKLADWIGRQFKVFPPHLIDRMIRQEKVKLEVCRPGEVPIVQDSGSRNLYLILEGELGIYDTFGEIRRKDGSKVVVKGGETIGEIALLTGQKRTATVLNNSGRDAYILKISEGAFKELYEYPEFRSYVDGVARERLARNRKLERFDEIKNLMGPGFAIGPEVRIEVQQLIWSAAQKTYKDILAINSKATPADLRPLMEFIIRKLEGQDIDNLLRYVSHGADHSVNTMQQTEQLILNSVEIRKALQKRFMTHERGRILAQLVALFHDIGYPEVSRLAKTGQKVPKFKHQEFSGRMVREELGFEALRKAIPGFTPKEFELFVSAIEHHGSDSMKGSDLQAGRPYRFAALADNPLLVLMRLSDNMDMLRKRLNAIQTNREVFIPTLRNMFEAAEKIKAGTIMTKEEKERSIARSNQEIKAEAFRRIRKILAEQGAAAQFEYGLMEGILKDSGHEDYQHFISVDVAQNISVKVEGGKIELALAYNTPQQFIPRALADFQTGRLKISLGSIILSEASHFEVDGRMIVIDNGKLVINGKPVEDPSAELLKEISEALGAAENYEVRRFSPPPSRAKYGEAMEALPRTSKLDMQGAFYQIASN